MRKTHYPGDLMPDHYEQRIQKEPCPRRPPAGARLVEQLGQLVLKKFSGLCILMASMLAMLLGATLFFLNRPGGGVFAFIAFIGLFLAACELGDP